MTAVVVRCGNVALDIIVDHKDSTTTIDVGAFCEDSVTCPACRADAVGSLDRQMVLDSINCYYYN